MLNKSHFQLSDIPLKCDQCGYNQNTKLTTTDFVKTDAKHFSIKCPSCGANLDPIFSLTNEQYVSVLQNVFSSVTNL